MVNSFELVQKLLKEKEEKPKSQAHLHPNPPPPLDFTESGIYLTQE